MSFPIKYKEVQSLAHTKGLPSKDGPFWHLTKHWQLSLFIDRPITAANMWESKILMIRGRPELECLGQPELPHFS